MYKRLVVFGDSFTYGHGLADCHEEPYFPGKQPSKLGWPQILANTLNIPDVLNLSFPGCSNRYITHAIVNYSKFNKDDLVLVQFTFPFRDFYFDKHTNIKTIGLWTLDTNNPKDLDEHWKFYLDRTDQELLTRSFENYLLSYFFLKQKNVTFYLTSCYNLFPDIEPFIYKGSDANVTEIKEGRDYHTSLFINYSYKIVEKHFLKNVFNKAIDYGVKNKDYALDGNHFGEKTHKFVAKLISESIF